MLWTTSVGAATRVKLRWVHLAGLCAILALWLAGWSAAQGWGGGWPSSRDIGMVSTDDTDQGVAMSGVYDSSLNMYLGNPSAGPEPGAVLLATTLRIVVATAIIVTVLLHFNFITAVLGVVGFVVISALIDVAGRVVGLTTDR